MIKRSSFVKETNMITVKRHQSSKVKYECHHVASEISCDVLLIQ